jgi:hypothetical protein
MSDEQKTAQETPRGCCKGVPFAAIMDKMMRRHGSGCNCAQMMSQKMSTGASNAQDNQSDSGPEPRR